ncbi:hypothetical protein B5807_08340 [Epicoccum nigrum]|uniref:Uncharacterized protein n=1 Tax=Epicoccum nigrum TaxID=105696 RepID=A0A1Y2LR31_EPING|nr:hypothetical protein B5807_08340 [Epicoccum nigrum]
MGLLERAQLNRLEDRTQRGARVWVSLLFPHKGRRSYINPSAKTILTPHCVRFGNWMLDKYRIGATTYTISVMMLVIPCAYVKTSGPLYQQRPSTDRFQLASRGTQFNWPINGSMQLNTVTIRIEIQTMIV